MDTVMKADIFFFVTTIAVVVFMTLASIALWYLIKILRSVRRAADSLEGKIESASEQAEALYGKLTDSVLFNLIFTPKRKKR